MTDQTYQIMHDRLETWATVQGIDVDQHKHLAQECISGNRMNCPSYDHSSPAKPSCNCSIIMVKNYGIEKQS